MIVVVRQAAATLAVIEPEALKSLSLATDGGPQVTDDILRSTGHGHLDGEHAWLDIDHLRASAGRDQPEHWVAGFNAMIDFARTRGWVSDDGSHVRAHVVRA